LITDAATGTAEMPGGLGAILTQVDKEGKFYAISFASRQRFQTALLEHDFVIQYKRGSEMPADYLS